MKIDLKPHQIKLLALLAGAAGLLLRVILYLTGVDGKGLLKAGHPAGILVVLVAVVTAAALLWLTRSIQGTQDYEAAFPVSGEHAVACFLLGGVLAFQSLGQLGQMYSLLLQARTLLGLAAAAALLVGGVCRLMGRRPHFLLHTTLCLYFTISLVADYRSWSANPQLQDYAFQMLAGVCLAMTAYYRAGFEVGILRHDRLWLYSLGAVFCCLLALLGEGSPMLYFAGGLWAWTGISRLEEKHRRPRPALDLEET